MKISSLKQQRSQKAGMIMVFVLMLMPICIILGSVMISNIMSEKHNLRYEKAKGQSFYLAETGLNAAYYAFSATNFSSYTHTKANDDSDPDDAGTQVSSGSTDPTPLTLTSGLTNNIPFKQESDGWYAFRWDPKTDELKDSLTHSGQQEIIRFRVTRTYYAPSVANGRETAWEIVCEATLGTTKKTHRLSGQLEGIATHAIFDAGNLNEFIRGANQNIYGKVHANGDIYLKPSGTTLTVETGTTDPSFTTAGRFWYGKDATGRTNMGTVKVGADSGSIHTWPSKLDSASANWATDVTSLWNDIVKDSALGATVKGVPPVQSFKPDGYYANTAEAGGLRIYDDGGTVKVSSNGASNKVGTGKLKDTVKPITFYNVDEKRTVNAVEIDVKELKASDYANGLIYSEKPVVLINAEVLPQNTSIVSQSGVYTLGDFNKELGTEDSYKAYSKAKTDAQRTAAVTKKSAAIMTTDRIWHLSKDYDLNKTNTDHSYSPGIDDPETYSGDNKHVNAEAGNGSKSVIEINSLLLDGAPLYDENWNRKIETDPDTGEQKAVPKWGPTNPDPSGGSASWDDYVEQFGGGRVVKKRGSIIHLQNATMEGADTLNTAGANLADGVTAWYRDNKYNPPTRDYGYDPLLKASPPPFTPFVASRSLWKHF